MYTPLTFEEVFTRRFRLMVICGGCRHEVEVLRPMIPHPLMQRFRRHWLNEVLAAGIFRCRLCNHIAGKLLVRAMSATGRMFTIEGHPAHKFGQLAVDEPLAAHHFTEAGEPDHGER